MKRFRKVSITSGIVFGMGLVFLDAVFYFTHWLLLILYGLSFGLVVGISLGGLAYVISKKTDVSFFSHVLMAFSLTLLGLALSAGIFIAGIRLPQGSWSQIESPPEKPLRFVDYPNMNDFGTPLYIESESGNLYSFECNSEGICNWVAQNDKPLGDEYHPANCSSDFINPFVPPPRFFNNTTDEIKIDICTIDYYSHRSVAILNDGTIQYWFREYFATEVIFQFFLQAILGIVSGFSGYLVIFFRKDKKNWMVN